MQRYSRALLGEIESTELHQPLQTLYFGGGTPSALPRAQLQALATAIFAHFQTRPGSIECTLEANPARSVGYLDAWLNAGINRLSVGVQSFDDDELHRLGRQHDGATAGEFCAAARKAGFDNISIDLIAGVPGQDMRAFERSLHHAIELGVNHISIYGLTIEEGTPYAQWFQQNPSAFPDDDVQAALLDRAHDILETQGFVHYEVSNFARDGFQSAHNIGYWRQRNCLAFGMSAAGYDVGLRYRNTRDLGAYCEAIETGTSARVEEERLSREARIGEAAMLALRTAIGISYQDFSERYGIDPRQAFANAMEKCKAAGLLEQDDCRTWLSRRGRLLANVVCAEFLEPQLSPMVVR